MLGASHREEFADEMQDFQNRRATELRARNMAEFAVQMQEYRNSLSQRFRSQETAWGPTDGAAEPAWPTDQVK